MNHSTHSISQSVNNSAKPLSRIQIPESARESLMSMMRQIMEKSQLSEGELHYIPQQSVQESLVVQRQDPKAKSLQSCQSATLKSSQQDNTNIKINNHHSLPSQQFSKLIQITQRCSNYYTTFFHQKQSQLQIIEKTFTDLNTNLNTAFEQIINELVKKQKELKQFLLKKYEEIVTFRTHQDHQLKTALQHIENLKYPTSNSQQLSLQLHSYASTLNEFYTIMEDIEKSNFKQMVEDSVNFINNLVTQEVRVTLYEKIPARLGEKHMIRDRSKDFLTESMERSAGQMKTDTFAILDIDSFTKLFFDQEEIIQSARGAKVKAQIDNTKAIDEFSKDKNKKISNNIKENDQMSHYHPIEQFKSTKMTKSTSKQCLEQLIDQKAKPLQKQTSTKKQTSISPSLSPNRIKSSLENCQNQSQLQLIRKISYQQSNRSAKIKGYMVTFQDPKLASIDPLQQQKISENHLRNSKSPCQVTKTPTKMNRSTEKKPLTSSISINQSNEQKLKNSSLKTSRGSVVSEFKVTSSRRPSIANNK